VREALSGQDSLRETTHNTTFFRQIARTQSCSVGVNYRQMEFSVWDVQHIWLELTTLLDYMEIYKS
jgi:hypothetical protein